MEKEINFAKRLAKQAGRIILDDFHSPHLLSKSDGSLLTAADKRINTMVILEVKQHFPGYSILGEEESFASGLSHFTWVCDPIDGTLPYVLGVPTCVFSLTLLNNEGVPIAATVYDPFQDKCYWAIRNGGAFMNNTPLRVNQTKEIKHAYIGNSGRSSPFIDAKRFKNHIYSHSYRPIILHSVIYEAMLVASGKIAAAVMTGNAPHDAASAKLIVEEAGGKVTDLFGDGQYYNRPIKGAVISNGLIHEVIVDKAKNCKL